MATPKAIADGNATSIAASPPQASPTQSREELALPFPPRFVALSIARRLLH
jgi:hypothetical protein